MDTKVSYHVLVADELWPWQAQLRGLEESIRYPLDESGDSFYIDHGEDYGRFFHDMGDARFLLATRDAEVLGLIAAAWKEVMLADGTRMKAVYAGDYKVRPDVRGSGIAAGIFGRGLWALLRKPDLWGASFAYGAAMRMELGDVRRSFRKRHPGRLVREVARQTIYFADPRRLEALRSDGPQAPQGGLELSVDSRPGLVSTLGKKDIKVTSTGEVIPLLHLATSPSAWSRLGATLQQAGREALDSGIVGARVCFGVDQRLSEHHRFLEAHDIVPDGTASIIVIVPPWHRSKIFDAPWVHLATSEI